jgi:hypothetical protein
MIIHRLEASAKIPAALRKVYGHLAGIVIETLGCYEELITLFGDSKETIQLMNATAPAFFMRHEHLLIDHIILCLSRLTDENQSGSRKNRQENLTLARLLELPEAEFDALRVDLKKKWKEIKAAAEPVRLYRHKLLAHMSLMHYLSPSTSLANGIMMKSVRNLLDQILDYLAAFDYFFTGVDTPVGYPASYGDATDLIAYLRLTVEAEKKRNDELRRDALKS